MTVTCRFLECMATVSDGIWVADQESWGTILNNASRRAFERLDYIPDVDRFLANEMLRMFGGAVISATAPPKHVSGRIY